MLEKSYVLEKAPHPPMPRNEYAALAISELNALLDSGEEDECRYQELLERHPCLVPCAYPTVDVGHNGIYPDAVITQPPLTGIGTKRPDFCSITFDSGTLYATFVEIESPCKEWSTSKGAPSAKLQQALQQLRDWQIWFKQSDNARRFLEEYAVPDDLWRHRDFAQHYVLLYGRRADLERSQFQRKRAALQHDNETIMSWDRIRPNPHYPELLTVRLTPLGFQAVTIPPTTSLGPHNAESHARLRNREQAVAQSSLIPVERRDFMIRRWPYWDDWARKRADFGMDIMSIFDCE